jgi:sialic acid synthase SpsE
MSGAKVFEKHFTLSKRMYGADARFSLEPMELKGYISGLHFISTAMVNQVDKNDIEKYKEMKLVFEKSIVAAKDLEVNHILNLSDLNFKKPGNGIRADKYKTVIGKKLLKPLKKDEVMTLSDFQ